ncbi:MAG TPA: ATP F0F1 synthase subunit B [Phenylobacterium sp.]|jgi:F-type H+-transporting ATPase subunit b|nr:ATP F0F1 synthase subunit B [Phenylobacterium sp.]
MLDAHFWVGVALVIFLVILWRAGVHRLAAQAIDSRAEKLRARLAEAEALRAEAQALLDQIKVQHEHSEKVAAEILANAQDEAKRLQADAQVKLAEQIKRRGQLAERRIETAESQAAASVKAAAAELAAQMAEDVLKVRLAGAKSDPLIDQALGQLAGKMQ